MKYLVRFATWTIIGGVAGLLAGSAIMSGSHEMRAATLTIMTAAGMIAGALGGSAQEIARALRDRK